MSKLRPSYFYFILKRIFLAGLLMGVVSAAVQAGWQKDEVCQGSCGGGCGPCPDSGSSSSASTPAPNIAWGGMTKRATGMVKDCNGAPGCILFRSVVLVPIGVVMDVPIFAIKGVGYGLYYGGKGIVYAGKGVGHAVAYPFNRPAKVRHTEAVTMPVPAAAAVPAVVEATAVAMPASAGATGSRTDPGAQLKSIERHSQQAADVNGLAASGEAKQGFDTSGKDNGSLVYTPRMPQRPLPDFAAKLSPAAQNDPAIKNSIAWYQHLDRLKEATQQKIVAVKEEQKKPGADTVVLAAQLGTLTNQMNQSNADQAKAQKTVEERVKHMGLDWQEPAAAK